MVIIMLVLITLNIMFGVLHIFTGMWWWVIIHTLLTVLLYKETENMF